MGRVHISNVIVSWKKSEGDANGSKQVSALPLPNGGLSQSVESRHTKNPGIVQAKYFQSSRIFRSYIKFERRTILQCNIPHTRGSDQL